MASFNSAVIARVAAALYDVQLGNQTMEWAEEQVNSVTYGGSVPALVQGLYNVDFTGSKTHAEVAAIIVANVGITNDADAVTFVTGLLDTGGDGNEGATIVTLLNQFSAITTGAYAAAASAFNAQITAALAYAQTPGTIDAPVHPESDVVFTLSATAAAGADVMRLTGNQDVRIDFTNPANQITGLDVDGDGLIEFNGIERSITGLAADFEIVDAYSRNPLDHTDSANNFLGDIYFDGTGFDGDGVDTDGNIFLGGLGHDEAFGGIGNDFLAGGGIAQGHGGMDMMHGGRNADFFFAEFSGLDAVDGSPTLWVDGGNTADDVSAGNEQSPQDADWLLFEASDDDEPVQIWLNDDNLGDQRDAVDGLLDGMGRALSRSGESMQIDDVENVDASGNLYGFLDDMDTEIGGRAADSRDGIGAGAANYGFGSSAQLWISGSNAGNIIIAGYDNDYVEGRGGDDLLMGGRLDHLRNPNLGGIWNDGRDELVGGDGADNIVFETDGGIYEGGNTVNVDDGEPDTLWLTDLTFGTRTATDVASDGTVRLDLLVGKVGGLANAAGYGGADAAAATGNYTSDQTNYNTGYARAQVQDFESIIATGLGAVDYLASGANDPELNFANQQNLYGFMGNLHLRGTDGTNTLYAAGGTDVLEGRGGRDYLSGGDGNDDFYFGTSNTAADIGDGLDTIHRQTDADGDNIWDGTYERDFNIGGSSSTGASSLTVDLGTTDLNSPDVALTSFSIQIDGVAFTVADTAALMAATSAAAVAAIVNTAYQAQDAQVSAVAVGNTIVVTDLDGRDISDTVAEGYAVGGVVSNGAFSALATFNPAGTTVTKDRLIYKSYEDRVDNEGVDDDAILGSIISLGIDSYAEDLVINFEDEDGDGAATTRLAEDQSYVLTFTNLTTQDIVTITVNGVNYKLQVGVDVDGNIIAGEDGQTTTNQVTIQTNFLARLAGFINSFMDDDTSAGEVAAAATATTITLTQVAYNGEETVFMTTPKVVLQNLSGGEPARVTVSNTSEHEVELLDFDGRNAELNQTNVLFWGQVGSEATSTAAQEAASRAELSTAKTAGDTLVGTEATVIDVGTNNLQSVVYGTTTAVPDNTTTNGALWNQEPGWSVHGDDFLIGGAGLDTISGGTGDDRVEGSIGGNGTTTWDVLDGGKNFYAVQVLGEAQARVYVLNKWEAANPTKVTALQGLTISSINLINQNETGAVLSSGVFDDTLQFSQRLFTPGVSRFTITLDNFTLTGGVVELRNDGAGTVGVDTDGNGTIDNWTKFTNFENIRTVSGTGNAVAGDGQGNDTLNFSAMSSATTGANGIMYNLTNDNQDPDGAGPLPAGITETVGASTVTTLPGEVRYSSNAHGSLLRPTIADFESLVIKVDGVENVIGGTGDDLLLIDETEAAKNNTFTGDLGDDRVQYLNAFAGEATPGVAEPTITIKVDNVAASLGGTDTVTSTGGRVGTTVAVDTLNGVEFITLANRTAASTREDDVLDVTAMTSGAIVNYVDGTVRALDNTLHLTVEGIDEIENVWADGNDTVIVADADTMNGNQRSDAATGAGTDDRDIAFSTFVDFDTLNASNARIAFISQTTAQIEDVINPNQFTFNLSKTGTGADSDTVDYSNAVDSISVVVELDATRPDQYVLVDSDGATFYDAVGDLEEAGDRIDHLVSVERIVASRNESVLDLSSSTKGLEIKWSAYDVANQVASLDRDVYTVRISDLSTASPLQRAYVEYRDAGLSATTTQNTATWNRIEGSDNAEVVVMNSAHSMDADTFNLRGGANQVKYNELTKSITLTLSVADWVATTPLTTGLITGTVQFQDGTGAGIEGPYIAGSQTHTIRSYTANNGIATGSLKVAASQDAEDTLKFAGLDEKLFLLSEAGTVDNQITVKLGSGAAQNSVILTGFELVSDAASNDVYDFGSLVNAAAGLDFVDNAADHDTVKVGNDAIGFDGTFTPINAGATEISLASINDNEAISTALFDFDVLDVTKVTNTTVTTLTGVAAGEGSDEVVIGAINNINSALDFEAVVFTQGTITENGATYVLNATANTVTAGAKTITLSNGANTLSFGGISLEGSFNLASSLAVTSGVNVTTVDTGAEGVTLFGGAGNDSLTGAAGADNLRGGSGADTLDGSFVPEAAEVHTYTLSSTAGGLGLGAGETVTINGVTVTEGAVVAGVTVAEDDADAIGAAFVRVWAATPALFTNGQAIAPNNEIASVTYDALTNALTFTFKASAGDVADGLLGVAGGSAAADVTAETVTTAYAARGESSDTYVFEATAALNGADTLNNFNAANAVTDDLLDFTAFLGGAAVSTAAVDITAGLDLITAAATVGVVFNKGSLAAADITITPATAGKVAVADNGKAVVLVTADVDGVTDSSINPYLVYYVEDTNATAGGAGNQTWAVTLVGTINSAAELNAADFITGTDSFV
ncbi:MAG: hypothetical protein HUU30_12600 [Burkholderiaceae bacterium]|nr:hypothetical protein [Aquabacterium sp.]NUP86574.1 hypothetical protein [Burkholderiaceae bacterium]